MRLVGDEGSDGENFHSEILVFVIGTLVRTIIIGDRADD